MSAAHQAGEPDARAALVRLYRCESCGALNGYPRAGCSRCGGKMHVVPASGRGAVYSYTVVHRAPTPELRAETPYVIVIVRTQEGPHVMGRMEGPEPTSVDVGVEVVAVTPRHPERGYFAFVPAAACS